MTDEEAAFLAAIAAAPGDHLVRLVYADWLDEAGRPGGEFLRTEAELVAVPTGQHRWHEVFKGYQRLGAELPPEWRTAVCLHPMDHWLAVSARSAWTRLENWCRQYHPRLLEVLNPGATPEEIAAVEEAIGQRLPVDVRESFAIHNGGDRFVFGQDLRSTTELISEWQLWRGLEDMNEEIRYCMSSFPALAIQLDYSNPGWVPLANTNSDYLGVDLAPGPAGSVGQVINFGRDEENKFVLASGWAEFLADYATFLESGAVAEIDPDPHHWGDCCDTVLGGRHPPYVLSEWLQDGRWPAQPGS